MSSFYLHAVNANGDIRNIDNALIDFEGILNTGAILTRRSQGLVGFGFNGTRYVSLSDYDKRFNHVYKDDPSYYDYTGYEMYSTKTISIMIDKTKVKAIIPKLVEPIDFSFISMMRMYGAAFDLIDRRMSDLPDEVQVKGNILEDAFIGVTIPSEEIIKKINPDKLRQVYQRLKILLEKYKYNLSMYNVSDMILIESEEDIESIIKRS